MHLNETLINDKKKIESNINNLISHLKFNCDNLLLNQ